MEPRLLMLLLAVLGPLAVLPVAANPERRDQPAPVPAGGPEDPDAGPGPGERPRGPGHARRMPPFKPFLIAGHPDFTRMLEAALAPPEELEARMSQLPRYQEMDERERQDLRQGIERFRRRVKEDALQDARQRGIAVPEAREAEFVRAYWQRRARIERRVRERAEAEIKTSMAGLEAELKAAFGSAPPADPGAPK